MERLAFGTGSSVAMTLRRRVAWPHPEWWALAISAVAWLLIVRDSMPSPATHHSPSMPTSVFMASQQWLLMVLAMMLPLCVEAIRATADRSLWRRRHRAIALWLAGYVSVWIGAGAALLLASAFLSLAPGWIFASIAFVGAAVWQASPARAHAFTQAHRVHPLAPDGWHADVDCLRSGWMTGLWCSASCSPLMIACWLAGHGVAGLAAMAAATLILLNERYSWPRMGYLRMASMLSLPDPMTQR